MEHLLLIIIGILLLVIFVLAAKVYFLRKSAQEISEAFRDRLAEDTNTLIDISTRDPYMRKLATNVNVQLRLLRKERHRYQQGDQELKEAVTNISHDLRTPLTAINGYLDLLEREEKSENVQRYLSQIKNRTDVLKNLTEELFRYSVVASSQNLKPEHMDVVRALEESLLSFYAVMQEKGIQPEIELPEEPVFRELDAGAVNRIFSNIISNVLKYSDGDLSVVMDKSGSITFSNTAHILQQQSVNTADFMIELKKRAKGLCSAKGIFIDYTEHYETTQINIDQTQLLRAYENVLSNAVEHTPEKETIFLRIAEEHKYLKIIVRDMGTGFSSEALKRATEQFYMDDDSRNSKSHYGIGLYTADTIVKHHNGQLILSNDDITGGAVVTIAIPV